MLIADYCKGIVLYRQKYNGSITSWGRSVNRAIFVGGFDGDPHTWDFGVDMIYDDSTNPKNFLPNLPIDKQAEADAYAKSLGLSVIHEADHDHFQPIGWINHPHALGG